MIDLSKLRKSARELYREALALGGLEIHECNLEHKDVKSLVENGLVEFGHKRGPGMAWQRMWAIEDEERI